MTKEPKYRNLDGDICAECGNMVTVRPGSDWEDGDICDSCVREAFDFLNEALRQFRDDIIRNATDTVWVGPAETACERITTLLGDDWGKDGKCEARENVPPRTTPKDDDGKA